MTEPTKALVRKVNRAQMFWRSVDVEKLVAEDHAAREIARRCEWDPGFQWLTGGEVVNYHTLAEVRVEWAAQLEETFTQVLGLLSAEGLIQLEQVMQDGTKIRALASGK